MRSTAHAPVLIVVRSTGADPVPSNSADSGEIRTVQAEYGLRALSLSLESGRSITYAAAKCFSPDTPAHLPGLL